MTLTPEQTQWIAALRSGQYRQTKGLLENLETHGFCCLGVGCDLFLKETRQIYDEELESALTAANYGPLGDVDYELAPEALVKKLRLRDRDGSIDLDWLESHGVEHAPKSLADMNDTGATFTQIADFIEAYPEAVFVS